MKPMKKVPSAYVVTILTVALMYLCIGCGKANTAADISAGLKHEFSIQAPADTVGETEKYGKLSPLSIETDENVFLFSPDDFISSYNSLHQQKYGSSYLPPSAQWLRLSTRAPYFDYDSDHHRFSEDGNVWSMPTISIYTPANDDKSIYVIELSFDDHGFQEQFFKKFEEICFYSLKTVLPERDDSSITALYTELYSMIKENNFGDYLTYADIEKPKLSAVYYYGQVGFFGYYGAGTANICIIPMTNKVAEALKYDGVELISFEEQR